MPGLYRTLVAFRCAFVTQAHPGFASTPGVHETPECYQRSEARTGGGIIHAPQCVLVLSVTTGELLKRYTPWATQTCLVDGTYVWVVHLNGGHRVVEQVAEDLLVAVARGATLDVDLLVVSSRCQVNVDGRLA